jgi:hypothetical protein
VIRQALVLLFAAASCAAAAHTHSERAAAVREWVDTAETQLSRGLAIEAAQSFDRAAGAEHAADIEVGLVRSYMQGGEFRRAMAFASHTAGAHGDESMGAALYVWLLQLSGQRDFALRLLQQARQRLPADALLTEMQAQLASPTPSVTAALLKTPARLAPYASGARPPDQAVLVANGLLIDAGRHALVPSAAVNGARELWLRDGLGRTRPARVERQLPTLPLTLLTLDGETFGDAPLVVAAARDAFPGSPGYTLSYTASSDATPAWPWLRVGFLGGLLPGGEQRRLGIELPSHALPGGPVFDVNGQLVGLAAAESTLMPVSALQAELGPMLAAPAPQATPARVAADELYERSLKTTLQVIVLR